MSFDASQYVQSPWLHGSDLPTEGPTVFTIKAAREHTFDDGTRKPVISFYETAQELVCNRTQTKTLIGLFGANAAGWLNQRISLMPVASAFEGKPSIAIGRAPAQQAPPTMTYQGPADGPPQVHPEVKFQ